ncbi:MAG: sigma-54-dependent Fis family transcriptional regulator [Candidatus Scalindua sp. AMX11]|nr:MAG: sigma-54-dependent Fis family transcriptional regulator [Candidatus Scalindua sp.]NOG83737.1 sigma-54-dependent Fis family transcriptional regulator [Planctomycetota bacterium]RZV73866.1 MAG: sigma-54-dependent Fis family transcriptional regulator [Candidatus Scalindua sp. SCAELEC01]TDE64872.1 MAG: sigma-54-dependent Fis family transcriptional regulator [Candidatus Scalindua sp. AMX11]
MILVVDDQESIRLALAKMLTKEGYEVVLAEEGEDALEILRKRKINVILTDLRMPKMDGIQLLRASKLIRPEVEVILITAHGTIEKAVDAMKLGAYDFITKPFKKLIIVNMIKKAIEKQALLIENRLLHEQLERSGYGQADIVGQSDAIRDVIKIAEQVAPSQASVLIQGESGTGKEAIAALIHKRGTRKDKPFIKMSCAALPETLLESELFGYEKGAFTGAASQKEGRFELAHNGTLLLDEIGEIVPSLQVKLLRVLQEGEFERLGGTKVIRSNVRIISATNVDLTDAIKEKKFREDLFYRLNVITITIPPLRDRKEDIPLLVSHFLKIYQEKNDKPLEGISEETLEILTDYKWPGNVRELKNVVERAVVLTQDNIVTPHDLPDNIVKNLVKDRKMTIPFGMSLREIEKKIIVETLKRTNGDKEITANLLGIASRTIYRKMNSLEDEKREEQ